MTNNLPTKPLHLVMNSNMTEGFITDDAMDARTAQTGGHVPCPSSVAVHFHEMYNFDKPKRFLVTLTEVE